MGRSNTEASAEASVTETAVRVLLRATVVGTLIVLAAAVVIAIAAAEAGAANYAIARNVDYGVDARRGGEPGKGKGGVLLADAPGGFYMGRLFKGETFQWNRASYKSMKRNDYFLGYADGNADTCAWIGPSNGKQQQVYYFAKTRARASGRCSKAQIKWLVDHHNEPRAASSLGSHFNCAPDAKNDRAAWGQLTKTKRSTLLYLNMNWKWTGKTYDSGPLRDAVVELPRGYPVFYRLTTRDGRVSVIYTPKWGWGFVTATDVPHVSGRWNPEGKRRSVRCSQKKPKNYRAQHTAIPAPHWRAWTQVGGAVTSAPSVTSWGFGRTDLVVRGRGQELRHRSYETGRGWSKWRSLGGVATSDPSVVSWGNGRLDVFVRGEHNDLLHRAYKRGKWSQWESLGGYLTSGPAAVSWARGRLDVFVRGGDATVYQRSFAAGAGWGEWTSLGGDTFSEPAAVSRRDGQLDLFARSTDDQLLHRWFGNGQWSEWEVLPGPVHSGVSVASWNKGRLDVFTNTIVRGLRQLSFQHGSGWSQAWQPLRFGATSKPATVAWGASHMDAFVRGPDGGLWSRSYR